MSNRHLAICPVLGDWDLWTVEHERITLTLALCGGLLGGLALLGLDDGRPTLRRRPIPPGRLCLDQPAAVSGRTWTVLFARDQEVVTLTASFQNFRPAETLDLHLAVAEEGPMHHFRASGAVTLGARTWDLPLSQTGAVLERVRGGRSLV